jgi:hypothetical protein
MSWRFPDVAAVHGDDAAEMPAREHRQESAIQVGDELIVTAARRLSGSGVEPKPIASVPLIRDLRAEAVVVRPRTEKVPPAKKRSS